MSVFPVNRVPDILKRMDLNSSQAEAMKTCFGILAIMSREDSNKILIAKDGMDIILNAMTTHVDRTDVQESGCDLLWSLAFNSSSVKDIIAKHGGATVLVRALKRHSRSADFLKSACGALSNMCQSKLNQEGVSSQGGLQPLVGSIHVHQTSAKLLPFIFDAIASIIVNNEDNARTVSSLGIIPVVVASLSRHKPCMEVVKSGCHTLAILSDVKGQASKIAFAGGVPIILSLLDAHPLYSDLHRVAAVVLLRMLQESAHVGREITCHEGVRILLNSLEKGGAQQDTVAAVTHILYTVTNPASPASSAIESQLWLHAKPPMAVTGAGLGGSVQLEEDDTTSVAAENNGRSRSSSAVTVLARDSPMSFPMGSSNNRKSILQTGGSSRSESPQLPGASSSGAVSSSLGGIALILGQYSARRDVVRAACRLVNNLSGYPNVVQALDKLLLLDRMLECAAIHRDTKDVVDSTAALLKAVHRKYIPTVNATAPGTVHGLLHLFRTKSGSDEDFAVAAIDVATRLVEMSSRLVGDRRREVDASRDWEGRPWELHIVDGCMALLAAMVADADKDGISSSSGDTLLPVLTASTFGPAVGTRSTSFSKIGSGKNTVRLVSSIAAFIENVQQNTRHGADATVSRSILSGLGAVLKLIPARQLDLARRLEAIISAAEGKDISSSLDVKASSSRDADSGGFVPISGGGVIPFRQRAGNRLSAAEDLDRGVREAGSNNTGQAQRGVSNTRSDSLSAASSESRLATSSSKGVIPSSPAILQQSASASELRPEFYKNCDLPLPRHPLKAAGGLGRLLNCWPNYLERLCPTSNQSATGILNQSSYSDLNQSGRMHVCYESATAAGRSLVSRCPTPVPYSVPPNGQGEPFAHSLTFDSEFESGNLLRAVQRGDAAYDLFLRSDLHTQGNTQWFYFAVSNTHPAELVRLHEQGVQVPPVRVRFNVVNLTKPDSLFNLGMRPVVYSCADASNKGAGWVRSGSDIAYYSNPFVRNNTAGEGSACYYTLTFTLEFAHPKDTVLVAYSYPYTMSDYRHHVKQILDRPKAADIIRQTRLCVTLGGEDCDLLVITNFRDKDRDRIGPTTVAMVESRFDDNIGGGTGGSTVGFGKQLNSAISGMSKAPVAFRDPKVLTGGSSRATQQQQQQPQLKPALFLSARVHPGETPASWMMKGMLDFLTSDCSQARLLRQSFVIFVVPVLNPDGVTHGNNRCSLAGMDLNRQWKAPTKALHPTVYYLKSFMAAQRRLRDVQMYIDLHGHSRKYNVFMYGCDSDKKRPKPQVRAFPKFFSMHSVGRKYVNFADCSFHVKKGRESTARVVVAKDLNIPSSFTLEATFCGSNYGPLKHCHMNIGHLQEVGAALCDAILNYCVAEGHIKDVSSVILPNVRTAATPIDQVAQQQSDGGEGGDEADCHRAASSQGLRTEEDAKRDFGSAKSSLTVDSVRDTAQYEDEVEEEAEGKGEGSDSGSDEESVGEDRGGEEEEPGLLAESSGRENDDEDEEKEDSHSRYSDMGGNEHLAAAGCDSGSDSASSDMPRAENALSAAKRNRTRTNRIGERDASKQRFSIHRDESADSTDLGGGHGEFSTTRRSSASVSSASSGIAMLGAKKGALASMSGKFNSLQLEESPNSSRKDSEDRKGGTLSGPLSDRAGSSKGGFSRFDLESTATDIDISRLNEPTSGRSKRVVAAAKKKKTAQHTSAAAEHLLMASAKNLASSTAPTTGAASVRGNLLRGQLQQSDVDGTTRGDGISPAAIVTLSELGLRGSGTIVKPAYSEGEVISSKRRSSALDEENCFSLAKVQAAATSFGVPKSSSGASVLRDTSASN